MASLEKISLKYTTSFRLMKASQQKEMFNEAKYSFD